MAQSNTFKALKQSSFRFTKKKQTKKLNINKSVKSRWKALKSMLMMLIYRGLAILNNKCVDIDMTKTFEKLTYEYMNKSRKIKVRLKYF